MLINNNTTARTVDLARVVDLARQVGLLDYHSAIAPRSNSEKFALLPRALAGYLQKINNHELSKGVRPWQLVDVTADLDKSQPWIGLEWETGFCSRPQYQATVQWMWQNHHNWAVDAEGVGPHFGEFTFPPCNMSDFVNGTSMLDSMFNFMEDSGFKVPLERSDVVDSGTYGWGYGSSSSDLRSGWGMHVNISVPGVRDNAAVYSLVTQVMRRVVTSMQNMSGSQKLALFGRNPYGYIYARNDGSQNLHWHEWKLFRTPGSREEIDNVRRVASRIAELTTFIASNLSLFYVRGSFNDRVSIRYPNSQSLYRFLSGEEQIDSIMTRHETDTSGWHFNNVGDVAADLLRAFL